MAKATKAPVVATIPPDDDFDDLDDLLGDLSQVKAPPKRKTNSRGKVINEVPTVDSAAGLEAVLNGDDLVGETKVKKERTPKELKGTPVTFVTKGDGLRVIGLGVLYYVVRMNKKLYYKEATQVTMLPSLDEDVISNLDNKLPSKLSS